MAAVLFLGANIGMAAFAGAVVLAAIRVADHEQAIRRMPWTPILMVSGVTRPDRAAREDGRPRSLHGAAGAHRDAATP